MTKTTTEQRELLKKLGYSDEMIDKLENEPAPVAKKKPFKATAKKMIRISRCLFCDHTRTTYYVLDEISFAAWEGHEVPKEEYLETKGIVSKPSSYRVKHCDNCPSFIDKMDEAQAKTRLLALIKPNIGGMPC